MNRRRVMAKKKANPAPAVALPAEKASAKSKGVISVPDPGTNFKYLDEGQTIFGRVLKAQRGPGRGRGTVEFITRTNPRGRFGSETRVMTLATFHLKAHL